MSAPIYKPLRPTRAFRKTDEKFLSKDDTVDIKIMFMYIPLHIFI